MAPPMIPPAAAPAFLAAHGWEGAEILPLAGDASFRRYFRVVRDGETAVLMDAPPDHEDIRPFLKVAQHLIEEQLSAPRTLAVDLEKGLLLLEDFGDRLLGPELRRNPNIEEEVYSDAVALLWHLKEARAPTDLASYDRDALIREVGLFPEWYCPALEMEVDVEGFYGAWDEILSPVLAKSEEWPVLVLRDFHADNIILLPRPGVRQLGLLDFQDALAGHPAYDMVSLLQDARRDVAPDLEQQMIERWLELDCSWDETTFRAHYEILGAQRNTKILGIFTRLWKRDGKPHYLPLQPRVWGYLERNFAHPALAPVRDWFDRNVPTAKRAAAWTKDAAA